MPVIIGAKPESSFADPIGLLTDCHRRIERFLAVLATVAERAHGGALSPEQRASMETALRYFREAAPKHTADEERTLFPRLRNMPKAEAVLARMESFKDDHGREDRNHAEADRLGRAWLASGALTADDAERLSALLSELTALYCDHMAVEERGLFPAAAALLSEAAHKAIGGEMAARRET